MTALDKQNYDDLVFILERIHTRMDDMDATLMDNTIELARLRKELELK